MAPISPIALFVIYNNRLMPVAMQLVQGGQVNLLLRVLMNEKRNAKRLAKKDINN